MRRGRRAALPDRAEVSARGPRGLGPPRAARPGRLRDRAAPSFPRGRDVGVGARPVCSRAETRSARPRPPGGRVWNPWSRSGRGGRGGGGEGSGIPGMRGGRRQPARGLQTSSPAETRACRAAGSAGPPHAHLGARPPAGDSSGDRTAPGSAFSPAPCSSGALWGGKIPGGTFWWAYAVSGVVLMSRGPSQSHNPVLPLEKEADGQKS